MKLRYLIPSLFLLLSSSVFAFDGDRKGFVIGGGLGFAPLIESSVEGFSSESKTKYGLGNSFFFGYALDENNVIVLMLERTTYLRRYSSNSLSAVSQGFKGPTLIHYFSDPGESGFMTVGLGIQYAYEATELIRAGESDIGFLIGGGYEFSPHFQFQVTLTYGKTKYQELPINHRQIIVSLTAVAF